jgi:hypothetical protein
MRIKFQSLFVETETRGGQLASATIRASFSGYDQIQSTALSDWLGLRCWRLDSSTPAGRGLQHRAPAKNPRRIADSIEILGCDRANRFIRFLLDLAGSAEPTGTPTTIFAAPFCRNASAAARMLAPVARPSARMTMRS